MPDIDIDKAQTIIYWVVGTVLGAGAAIASALGLKLKSKPPASDNASLVMSANEMQMDAKIDKLRHEQNEKFSEDRRRMYEKIEENCRDQKQDIAELDECLKALTVQVNDNTRKLAVLFDRSDRADRSPRRRT